MPRQPRRRITLVDLLAAIFAAGLGLGILAGLFPRQLPPMVLVIAPVAAILLDRARGRRGVGGGFAGGGIDAVAGLLYYFFGIHDVAIHHMVIISIVFFGMPFCFFFGGLLGLSAWAAASAMNAVRSVGGAGSTGQDWSEFTKGESGDDWR